MSHASGPSASANRSTTAFARLPLAVSASSELTPGIDSAPQAPSETRHRGGGQDDRGPPGHQLLEASGSDIDAVSGASM